MLFIKKAKNSKSQRSVRFSNSTVNVTLGSGASAFCIGYCSVPMRWCTKSPTAVFASAKLPAGHRKEGIDGSRVCWIQLKFLIFQYLFRFWRNSLKGLLEWRRNWARSLDSCNFKQIVCSFGSQCSSLRVRTTIEADTLCSSKNNTTMIDCSRLLFKIVVLYLSGS